MIQHNMHVIFLYRYVVNKNTIKTRYQKKETKNMTNG